MKVCRIFTGTDGKSHVEEIPKSALPNINATQPAASLFFREYPANYFMDWHPAPKRQWIVAMKGSCEIGLEDGTIWKFEQGDAFLAEDLTGKGHTSRAGLEGLFWIVIPLSN